MEKFFGKKDEFKMRVLKVDKKEGFFEVVPDNLDDLWHLERIIAPGDIVSAKSERKIKPKAEGMEVSKENVFFEVQAERIEFHEGSKSLRVMGVIVGGHPKELVELKAHHSLEVMPHKEVKVKKESLKNHHIERLRKAEKVSGRGKTLLVALDDEAAELAVLTEKGFDFRGKISSQKSGKRFKSEEKETVFFEKTLKSILETNADKVVIAGPGFTKSNFQKYLSDKRVKLNAFYEHIDSVGTTGLNELVSSGKIDKIVEEMQLVKETRLVERILELLGKNSGLAVISEKEAAKAVEASAVEHLILSDDFLLANRKEAESILEKAEEMGGEIHIISARTDAGKKVSGFGGVCAILRFRV